MKQIKVNPSNEMYYSDDFIKGFNEGAKRQFEADMADRKTEQRGCDADCNEDCAECAKETELWIAEQTEPQTERSE